MGGRVMLAMIIVAALLTQVMPVMAQSTPPAACADDSLYLISPDAVDLHLETTGKPGLTISWPNLDLSDATCFSLNGTDELGFEVSVTGGYGAEVDRIFSFATADSGTIGGRDDGNLTVSWLSQGRNGNGDVGGVFNLANNGGVLSYSQAGGSNPWSSVNNGLPMTWKRTNTVAIASGASGFMVAAFTRGDDFESGPAGLFTYNGTNWDRIGEDIFDEDMLVTSVAVSPDDNDSFAVGTSIDGLYVTIDGGETFVQWSSQLPSEQDDIPTIFKVTALNWDSSRLVVAMSSWGLFISENGGTLFDVSSISVPVDLDNPAAGNELPRIWDISVQPGAGNSDHIVLALQLHGAFESNDGGATWHDLYGDLLVSDPLIPSAWQYTAKSVVVDAADPQVIVMAISQKGLYRTGDGGATWVAVGGSVGVQPEKTAELLEFSLINRLGMAGEMLALENRWKLLHSTDSGLTWSVFADQPSVNQGLFVVPHRDNSGDFTIGTMGGGIYLAGITFPLRDTYDVSTQEDLRDADIGLSITFGDNGVLQRNDSFDLVAQTFQGWAVFRGAAFNPDEMKLIGLFDRVNPEDCFAGYCGDNSLEIVPLCFAAKRAACFDLSNPDTLRFFDEEVFNGFSYVYSVTSFDYGNMALTTAQVNDNTMLFSPRWTGDDLAIHGGPGNRASISVNKPVSTDERAEEIYAYPNPIRLGAGVPRGEGSLVVFTNLPEGSRVRVFTTAGDDVINLGPDNQIEGQIYWNSNNRNGETVAAGVYLYKVIMPTRDDYWGRIVVIR